MNWGSGPFDNDWAFSEFGVVVMIIAERVDAEVSELRDKPLQADQGVVAMVCCLRALGKVCRVDSALDPARVKGWQKEFFAWYEEVKKKLPAKYRDEIKTVAEKEFAQLLKCF
jgi:hypothetical protein